MTHDITVEAVKASGVWHAGYRAECHDCDYRGDVHNTGELSDQARNAAMDGFKHQRKMKEAAA